jgi:hypothetical protein
VVAEAAASVPFGERDLNQLAEMLHQDRKNVKSSATTGVQCTSLLKASPNAGRKNGEKAKESIPGLLRGVIQTQNRQKILSAAEKLSNQQRKPQRLRKKQNKAILSGLR